MSGQHRLAAAGKWIFAQFLAATAAAFLLAPLSAQVAADAPCTPEERREALRSIQSDVLSAVPEAVPSLAEAVRPGGALEGWRLSHGLVVLAGSGGVAIDNIEVSPPVPQVLIYSPSEESEPGDWLDFDGDDGPYRLVGWAFLVPYEEGSSPPDRPCIEAEEWFVHEAGWHLLDGGMQLTPGATTAPPSPTEPGGYFWHPQGWDIHFWRGADGVPTITFHNPQGRPGGLPLLQGTFYYLRDGQRTPPPPVPEGR